MPLAGMLIISLIPVAIVLGIVAAIVALARRGGDGAEEEPGIGTVRRLFYYGLAFVALMVAASGVILLVSGIVESLSGTRVLSGSETELALGLAMTLVGVPIWLLQWRFAQRATEEFPAETRAISRRLYVYLVLGVAAALGALGVVWLLSWVLGAREFEGTLIAFPLVWGAVWALHWRIATQEVETTDGGRAIRRLYVYLVALYGLSMLAVSAGSVLHQALGAAYDGLFEPGATLVGGRAIWGDAVRISLAAAAVGGAMWGWHWLRQARGDLESVLRQVYLHLFAVLGGAIAAVTALSVVLYRVLQWTIGVPDAASDHFRFLAATLGTLVVGGGVWLYHWAVIREEAGAGIEGPEGARRVYNYVVAALGLGTLANGMVILFATSLGIMVSEAQAELVGVDWWRNPLSLAITLVAVGAPVWGFFWFGAQRQVETGAAEERTALSRRVFIYVVLGVALLVTLGSLSALLFTLFQDVLEGTLSLDVLRGGKWSMGMLLMAGAISYYYRLVMQEDRALAPPPEDQVSERPARKTVVALISEAGLPFVRALETRLGYPVRRWVRADSGAGAPQVTDEALAEAERRIAEAEGDRVLLTVDASGVEALAYREA